MDRREFIQATAAIGGTIPFLSFSGEPLRERIKHPICVFSKTLQWLKYEDLASFVSDAGIDGIDLTVRPGGHVLPEFVSRDLPKVVRAARRKGISIPMIVTSLTDSTDSYAEKILKTASDEGISFYRLGSCSYDKTRSMEQNFTVLRERFMRLCELNEKYRIQGGYQNHAGQVFGAPVWDLWHVIQDLPVGQFGCQYDIHHAVAETPDTWWMALQAIAPYIRHACIKDFRWMYDERKRKAYRLSVPLGEGSVDYKRYFETYKHLGVTGPLSIHYEYPIGDPEDNHLTSVGRMKKILPIYKKDADTLREMLKKYNIGL